MSSAEIQLGPNDTENILPSQPHRAAAPPIAHVPSIAIVWSDALPSDTVRGYSERHLHRPVSNIYAAGAVTLTEDESVIERIDSQSRAPILIFVRAWEAPLLDLRDFIVSLRAKIGTEYSLIVVPVGVDRRLPTDAQRDTWSRWTATLADPALYLECGA